MLRILIADDHAVVRQGLKQILTDELSADFGEATSPHEVSDLLRKGEWDAVILDLTMPGGGGLDVLKTIKHEYPKLPVLVLSMHPEDQYAVRTLKAGAAGYLTKEAAPDQLVQAIQRIVRGGKYVSPTLGEKLATSLATEHLDSPHEILSDREYQVLCLIASGKTVKQISEELSLSVKTISTYRARILDKMEMKTNAELTHYAIDNRLV